MKAVIFLGNPGNDYRRTRHNAAWMMAEKVDLLSGVSWQTKFKGSYGQVDAGGRRIQVLFPHTFMNKSGESVRPLVDFFKLDPADLLLVHDDLELPFGVVGCKQGGGLGGHNGLRSVAQLLGTRNFCRFRIGISRPAHGSVSSYVLGRFSPDEEPYLDTVLQKAAVILADIVKSPELCARRGRQQLLDNFTPSD